MLSSVANRPPPSEQGWAPGLQERAAKELRTDIPGLKRGRSANNHSTSHVRSFSAFSSTTRIAATGAPLWGAPSSLAPRRDSHAHSESPLGEPRVIRRKLSDSPLDSNDDHGRMSPADGQRGSFKTIERGEQRPHRDEERARQPGVPRKSPDRARGQPMQPLPSISVTGPIAEPKRSGSPHPRKLQQSQSQLGPHGFPKKRSASAPVVIGSSCWSSHPLSSPSSAPSVSPPGAPHADTSSLRMADVGALDSQQLEMDEDIVENIRFGGNDEDSEAEERASASGGSEPSGPLDEEAPEASVGTEDTEQHQHQHQQDGEEHDDDVDSTGYVTVESVDEAVVVEAKVQAPVPAAMLEAQPLSPYTPLPSAVLQTNLGAASPAEGVPTTPLQPVQPQAQAPVQPQAANYAFFVRSASAPAIPSSSSSSAASSSSSSSGPAAQALPRTAAPTLPHAPISAAKGKKAVRFHPSSKRHDGVWGIHASFDRLTWDLCGGRLSFGPFVTLPFPDSPPLLDIFTCFTPAITPASRGATGASAGAGAGKLSPSGGLATAASSASLSSEDAFSASSSVASGSGSGSNWGWHWSPSVAAMAAAEMASAPPAAAASMAIRASTAAEPKEKDPVMLQALGASSCPSELYGLCASANDSHHHHGSLKHEASAWPLSAAELASVFGRLSALLHVTPVFSSYSNDLLSIINLMRGLESHGYNCDVNGEGSGEEGEQVDISQWLASESEDADIGSGWTARGVIKPSCGALPPLAHVNTPIGAGGASTADAPSLDAVSWCPGDMCLVMAAVAAREEVGREDDEDAATASAGNTGKSSSATPSEGQQARHSAIEIFVESAKPPPGLSRIRAPLAPSRQPSASPPPRSSSSQPIDVSSQHRPHPFVSPCHKATLMGPLLKNVFESDRYASSDPLKLRGMLTLAEALEYRLKIAVARRAAREVAAAIRSLHSVILPPSGIGMGMQHDYMMVSAARSAMAEIERGLRETFDVRSAGAGYDGGLVSGIAANRDKMRTGLDAAYFHGGVEGFTAALEAFAKQGEEEERLQEHQRCRRHKHQHHAAYADEEEEEDGGYESDGEDEASASRAAAASAPAGKIPPAASLLRPCLKPATPQAEAGAPISSPVASSGLISSAPLPFVFGRSSPFGGLGAAGAVLSRINFNDDDDDDEQAGAYGNDDDDDDDTYETEEQREDRRRYRRGRSLGSRDSNDDVNSAQMQDNLDELELEILGLSASSSSSTATYVVETGGAAVTAAVVATTTSAFAAAAPSPVRRRGQSRGAATPPPPPGAMTSNQFNQVLDLLASDAAAEDAAANFRNKRLGVAVPILPGGGGTSAKLSPNHLLMVRQLVLLLRHAMRTHGGSVYDGGDISGTGTMSQKRSSMLMTGGFRPPPRMQQHYPHQQASHLSSHKRMMDLPVVLKVMGGSCNNNTKADDDEPARHAENRYRR